LEGGTPFASMGVEGGYNWTQGKWASEPFPSGGPAPSPGSEVPGPFANENTGLDLGELGAGLLTTPDSEFGGYVQLGPLAAGAYAKPSFLGKNSCAHH
jgi:hypothetical protein